MTDRATEYRKEKLLETAKVCASPDVSDADKKKSAGMCVNNLVGKGLAVENGEFVTTPNINSKEVAQEMAAAFSSIEKSADPNKMENGFIACISGQDYDKNLAAAGLDIAKGMDSGYGAGSGNPYHNEQHMVEVMLITQRLAEINNKDSSAPQLDTHDKNLLAVAGLIHDMGHDGKGNGAVQARLELQSFEMAAPKLEQAGVSKEDMAFLKGALAATCVAPEKGQLNPNQYAKAVHEYNLSSDPDKKPPEQPYGEAYDAITEAFLGKPKASEMGMIVTDADLTPSAGLTMEHSDMQGYKLSGEFTPGQPLALNRNCTRFFLDNIVGASFDSKAGKAFMNENKEEIAKTNDKLIKEEGTSWAPRFPEENKTKDTKPITSLAQAAIGRGGR